MLHVAVILLAFALISQVMLTSTLHRRMRALEEEHDHLVEKVKAALTTTAEVVESTHERTKRVIESTDNVLKAANNVIAVGKEQTEKVRGLRESYEAQFELFQKLREDLEKGGEDGNC